MITDRTRLEIGGITTETTDISVPLHATHWTNPALPGRTFVRLTREPLLKAEELSLGVNGFELQSSTPVGHSRRRAIGFPAWPIIHDPANAQHALNLVGDLERVARTARSKPGFARDGIDALISQLEASAPHFLPTLLEEAGRIFLGVDNRTYAAQMFGRARDAERRHDLPIDEERHLEVFLEFAYAGALPVKELTAEATRLSTGPDPVAAYEIFRRLCIERIRGGLLPYKAMPKDLRKLAKAAGLDPAEEDRRVARELLSAPSISNAPIAFWQDYGKAFGVLASEPVVRDQLLELAPTNILIESWLYVLAEWKVTDDLPGSLGGPWFRRMFSWLNSSRGWQFSYENSPRLHAFAIRYAPDLTAEPLQADPSRLHMVPADLLDELAAAGVTFEFTSTTRRNWRPVISLDEWAKQNKRRDLTALAADPVMRDAFERGVERSYHRHAEALAAAAGTRPLVLRKVQAAVAVSDIRPLSLQTLTDSWQQVAPVADLTEDTELAALVDTVRSRADRVSLLADNLQLGSIAELSWPAAADAVAEAYRNKPAGYGSWWSPTLTMHWPVLAVSNLSVVHLVDGPDRRTVTHWANGRLDEAVPVGDDIAARWNEDYTAKWGWENSPDKVYEESETWVDYVERVSIQISLDTPAGRLYGAGLLRPGEKGWPVREKATVFHDGQDYWAATVNGCFELDPATGQRGRASLPDWLAEQVGRFPDHTLQTEASQLHPVTEHTAESPLGVADGLHRIAVLSNDESTVIVATDGTAHQFGPTPATPVGLLARPGGGHWVLTTGQQVVDPVTGQLLIGTRDNNDTLDPADLPRPAWHQTRPVDEVGSARLRAATPELAEKLLAAIPTEVEVPEESVDDENAIFGATFDSLAASAADLIDSPGLAEVVAWLTLSVHGVCMAIRGEVAEESESAVLPDPLPQERSLLTSITTYPWGTADIREVIEGGRLMGLADDAPTYAAYAGYRNSARWSEYLGRESALLALAAAPGRTVGEVRMCQTYWRAFRDAGWVDAEFSVCTFDLPDDDYGYRTALFADGVAKVDRSDTAGVRLDGSTGALTIGETTFGVKEVRPVAGPRVDLDAVFDALAATVEQGVMEYQPNWGARLAELTGMPLADAHLLAAGLPQISVYHTNFLPKEVRTAMGLKVAEADAARDRLKRHQRLWVPMLASGVPADDPAQLLTDGPDLEAMAAFWRAETGGPMVPPDVAEVLPAQIDQAAAGRLLAGLASDWLTGPEPLGASIAVPALLWLAENLPTDAPQREQLAESAAIMRATFWSYPEPIAIGYSYVFPSPARNILGIPQRDHKPDGQHQRGPFRVSADGYYDQISVIPAELSGPDDPQVAILAELTNTLQRESVVGWLATDTAALFAADVRPGPAGDEHDPRVRLSELVETVAVEQEISPEAATYYLQLLALAAPTDKAVLSWNGWTKAVLSAAAAELVEAGLVVTGKRARAGRTHFLPGGWLDMASPHLPIEQWKMAAYGIKMVNTKGVPEFTGTLSPVPPPVQFRTAWERCVAGDGPGFTELRTTRRRRR